MMSYERSEYARDNFGKFIHQFQPWNQDTYQETWKERSVFLNSSASLFYPTQRLRNFVVL